MESTATTTSLNNLQANVLSQLENAPTVVRELNCQLQQADEEHKRIKKPHQQFTGPFNKLIAKQQTF